MKSTNQFALGADPELFLVDEKGQPKSAIGIIEGSKEDPFKISELGHSVQVDNVLLEFNVPPSTNPEQMYIDIQFVLDWFHKNIPDGHSLQVIPSLEFPKSELNCEKACEFGCDPDYDVWKEGLNIQPACDNLLLRSAGGHVHISYPDFDMRTSISLIKALDLFLGVPSVLFDQDLRRRELYGKAGAFRFKKYGEDAGGVEYRTLSNFWIQNENYVNMVFSQVDKAFTFIKENQPIGKNSSIGMRIRDTINNGDMKRAQKLIEEFNII